MAAPTAPTTTLIVTEAYRQFGISSPTAAQLATAIAEGIEKVKRDIWLMGKRWKILRSTQYIPLRKGVSRYANPTDFESDMVEPAVSLLDGVNSGVLQTAAAGTATLAAADAAVQDDAEGNLLLITSGTGVNQAEQIDDYNATTKVATMRANWGTTPVTGDGYLIVNRQKPIEKLPRTRRNLIDRPGQMGEPYEIYDMAAGPAGYIELYPVPRQAYGLKRDYYVNLLLVDITGTLYPYILRNWAGILTQGVLAWLYEGYDDSRAQVAKVAYANMLNFLKARELDGHDDSTLQQRVSE